MSKQKVKNTTHTTLILVLVLVAIVGGALYLSKPFIENSSLYQNYQKNIWVTFKSERVKFSFKHPKSWPVSVVDFEAKNGMYKRLAERGIIEYVDFEEEFSSQAGGPSLGFIIIEKTNYKNLKEYVDELSKEEVVDMWVKGRTEKVTIKPPKIEYLKIDGEDAISITDTNNFATFTRNTKDYQLIRNGLLYRFTTTDSTRFLENKDENLKTFEQIIASVRF